MRKTLATTTWVLPAAILLLSGGAKIVFPEGTAPESLAWVTRTVSYPWLLRLLGAFEILVAVQILRPATRRTGVVVAIGLFAGFAVLVASNAHDAKFLANCGCFGGLPLRTMSSGLGLILLRNALLCGLLVAALAVRQRAWLTAGQAVGLAALVLFGSAYVAERRLRAYDHVVVAASRSGENLSRFAGQRMPDIELVAADGERTSSDRALRDNDHVMFFATDCPHCRLRAPQWAPFARRLAKRGARLVLFAIGDSTQAVEEFKTRFGCEELAHFLVPKQPDPHRWGIKNVPQLVVLGAGRRLVFHDGLILGGTYSAALATASRRVDELARASWDHIAAALFEPGTVCRGLPVRKGDLMIATVRTPRGEQLPMGIGAVTGIPTYAMELAFGFERDGSIRSVIPLAVAGYARVVDPDGELYDVLRGKSMADAVRLADKLAEEPMLEAPLWDAVGLLLRAMAEEFEAAPVDAAAAPGGG